MKYYNYKARQAGMTLIELTVVLLILIGLAGLMIPYVSGFVSKTHDATGDNNIANLNNTIQRFQVQSMKFPNNLQSLADVSGATYTELMNTNAGVYAPTTYVEGGAGNMQIMSLRSAGITSVLDLNQVAGTFNGTSATFTAAGAPVDLTMGSGSTLGVLTVGLGAETTVGTDDYASIEEHLADATGAQISHFNATCNDYVLFGIGQENEMIGKAMTDAPIHFAQQGAMGPDNNYNRFVAIFEVDKANGTGVVLAANSLPEDELGNALATADCGTSTHAAKFIGTAMLMMPPHLWGLAHSLSHTYENIANGN
ncbi:hypothetical protein AU255_04760 [Methyloprofundus sedimenti]|uniref:Prepilin-type N-terminal cleavage/methylation domain-containing protein n=1 Tax=Methyloprofundus sedimenti TaxID=1420851 RepID=A0A1V8M6N6_9GAMM|nr:hypothetical protein [Methyloprofundus sedimenti]OQK17207.1 hypothetical protein AU255_04760 [Methyloprofundus sedimenti]